MSVCGIGNAGPGRRRKNSNSSSSSSNLFNGTSNNIINNRNNPILSSNVLGNSSQSYHSDIEGLSTDNWCCLLSNFIGRTCECEFVLGDGLISRTGILNDVGTNYLILTSTNNNNSDILLCDTCSLRFVRVE